MMQKLGRSGSLRAMWWHDFCAGKAEECELHAAELEGEEMREWLQMAEDWLTAQGGRKAPEVGGLDRAGR